MGRILLRVLWTGLAFALSVQFAWAVRPTDDVIVKLKAEGRWETYVHQTLEAERRGMNQPDPYRLAAGEQVRVAGNLNALVLLVDFSDNPASANAVTDSAYFRDLLFSSNATPRSLNDFYQENSWGNVTVTGDVVGWIRMDSTYAYYVNGQRGIGPYPRNAQRLAEDAAIKADAMGVNYALYDNNGDNKLDGFFVVHAGPGFEETSNVNQIHSHKWVIVQNLSFDGVTITNYTVQPEEQGNLAPVKIGVFCHEFGHFLGLPDLYDIDGTSQGLDKWVLMAGGNYAKSDGSSPAHFSVWSKMKLGWITPTNVTTNMINAPIPQIETDSVAYRLWTGGAGGTQYFLVENRQKIHFDLYLPGEGLYIYHVDDTQPYGSANTNEWYPGHTSSGHYLLAMEQADGLWELEKTAGTGPFSADNGDPWPGGTNNTTFDDLSTPSSRSYTDAATQVAVWNISVSDSLMTANFDVTWSRPNFQLLLWNFTDNGNGNGIPEPGETVSMTVTQKNLWQGVTDASYIVTSDDTDLVFTTDSVLIGAVNSGATRANAIPFSFSVPLAKSPRIADFYITVTANGGAYVKTDTVRIDIGKKRILLVDDDARLGFYGTSIDSAFLIPALDSMRIPWARWEVYSGGAPTTLNNYEMVFWYTGDRRDILFGWSDSLLSPGEITALKNYLDGGGKLFLSGQQIARYLDSMDQAFLNTYLRAGYAGDYFDFFASGTPGDPVGDSLRFVLGGNGGAMNQAYKDLLTPLNGSVVLFTDTVGGNINGIRYDGTYKLVFVGWGVEGIGDGMTSLGGMPKNLLIERVANWFLNTTSAAGDEETRITPDALALDQNFPNPFNPSTTIRFAVGPTPQHVTLKVYNLLGRHVATVLDADRPVGSYEVVWNGRDESGASVGSGVYFYRLSTQDRSLTRKMVLLK